MSTTVKLLIAGVGIALLYAGVSKASKLNSLTQKLLIDVGTPRIHNISGGNVNVILDNITLTNQSAFSTTISNMFVTVQYQEDGQWKNLMVQKSSTPAFTIGTYGSQKLPPIPLSLALTDTTKVLKAVSGGLPLKVITRVVSNGIEFPIETPIEAKNYLAPLLNTLSNPLSLFNF